MNTIWLAGSLILGSACGLQIVGLYPAGLSALPGILLLLLALASVSVAALAHGDSRAVLSSLVVAFFLLGCGRTLLIHPPVTPADLDFYNSSSTGPIVTISGVVSAQPTISDRSQRLRISATGIQLPGNASPLSVHGDITVLVPRYPDYSQGETLALTGHLTAPPVFDDFDYAAYLARQGVFSQMSFPKVASFGHSQDEGLASFITDRRTTARATLQHALPEPEASIAVGVVTGDRSSISDELQDAFRRSGTTHILAISGQNISLLVGMVWLLFSGGQVKRRMPLALTLVFLVLLVAYTIFTGSSPSVVRAAIIGAVLILGPVVGRRYDPLAALAVSAAVMVVLDPDLLADAGFQFSFLALLGITFISPIIVALMSRLRLGKLHLPDLLVSPLSASIGAVIATLPIFTLLTGQLSLVAPFATFTADFALPFLMIAGIFTVIVGAIFASAASFAGLLVWPSAWWLQANARFWAGLPWATITTPGFTVAHAATYYMLLSLALLLYANRTYAPVPVRARKSLGLAALAVIALVVWSVALYILIA